MFREQFENRTETGHFPSCFIHLSSLIDLEPSRLRSVILITSTIAFSHVSDHGPFIVYPLETHNYQYQKGIFTNGNNTLYGQGYYLPKKNQSGHQDWQKLPWHLELH